MLMSIIPQTINHMPAISPVSIVSVNWSRTFIRACLQTALEETPTSKNVAQSIPIFANEICLGNEETCGIHTSADKLASFQNICGTDNSLTIYVGDTSTDFDFLVTADVGICVRDEPIGSGQAELKETLERVGIEVFRLSATAWQKKGEQGRHKGDNQGQEKKNVWWVIDLMEVVRFIEDSKSLLT
ncbi:hypothetical protein F4677DRAFT_419239 [Hypoxylon crocopeplum]|nr:hypothetical protein F4677DRAFT_419239 [Hypoxylon crocopeplum]